MKIYEKNQLPYLCVPYTISEVLNEFGIPMTQEKVANKTDLYLPWNMKDKLEVDDDTSIVFKKDKGYGVYDLNVLKILNKLNIDIFNKEFDLEKPTKSDLYKYSSINRFSILGVYYDKLEYQDSDIPEYTKHLVRLLSYDGGDYVTLFIPHEKESFIKSYPIDDVLSASIFLEVYRHKYNEPHEKNPFKLDRVEDFYKGEHDFYYDRTVEFLLTYPDQYKYITKFNLSIDEDFIKLCMEENLDLFKIIYKKSIEIDPSYKYFISNILDTTEDNDNKKQIKEIIK